MWEQGDFAIKRFFGSWHRLIRGNNAARRRRRRSVHLELEQLEGRLAPVVGAFALAPVATTGLGFDGVVAIYSPKGAFVGSGALLEGGRHILTAAHVVDLDNDGWVDPGTWKVKFSTRSGTYFFNVESPFIDVPDEYLGNAAVDGYDVAVITLSEVAPSDAERYRLNYVGDEVGKELVVVGYGARGTGNKGETKPAGVKRTYGHNDFDAVGQDVDLGDGFGPWGTLAYDFDNGGDNNPLGDQGYEDEGYAAHGDSGGPLFIDFGGTIPMQGGWLAGITSFGASGADFFGTDGDVDDIDSKDNSTWGEIGFATRVFNHLGWIQLKMGGGYELDVNMNLQPAGNDNKPDTIDVRLSPIGNVRVFVNNQLLYEDALSDIEDIRITGSADKDIITLSGSLRRPFFISDKAGQDEVIIDDSNTGNPNPTHIEISDDHVELNSSGGIMRVGFVYQIGSVTVKANTPTTGGNTIAVLDTPHRPKSAVTVHTGGGNDQVVVQRTSSQLTIHGQAGQDTVTVGTFNSLANILGSVGVTNEFGSTELNLNASADSARTVTIDLVPFFGINAITGLAPAPILYSRTGIRGVNINTGAGQDTFNIKYASVPITIRSGGEADVVNLDTVTSTAPLYLDLGPGRNLANIGQKYGLDEIQAFVQLRAEGGGTNIVYLDDRKEKSATTATLAGITYLRSGSAPISMADLDTLLIWGGSGGNFYFINDTPANAYTTLFSGTGRDSAWVLGTTGYLYLDFNSDVESVRIGDPEVGLDTIDGTVHLVSGGPGLSVVVDDIGVTAGQQVTIDKDGLRRSGAADIKFGSAFNFPLTYLGGSGSDTINVLAKRGKLSLLTGGGDDRMHIGSAAGKVSSMGNFIINGQGDFDTVYLHDEGQTTKRTYKFFSYQNVPAFETTYTRIDFADTSNVPVSESPTEAVILYAGQNSDKADVTWSNANLKLAILGGPGQDVIKGGSGRELFIGGPGADQLIGNGGEDIVIAGSTTLDTNAAALAAILAEWNRDLPYADRVDHLLKGGGLNGTTLLDRAAYIGDGVTNTLTSGGDLDLFYGNRSLDASDWNVSLGERFVDPSIGPTVIDATALSATAYIYTPTPENLNVLLERDFKPGLYYVSTTGGGSVGFTVDADGVVDYDPALEGAMTGRGTRTLVVHGRSVSITKLLSAAVLTLDYETITIADSATLNLLPGPHHMTVVGATVFFEVTSSGAFTYNTALEGALLGQGTTALTVQGRHITVDATAIDSAYDNRYLQYDYEIFWDLSAPLLRWLLPGSHHVYYGEEVLYFTVTEAGLIEYDAMAFDSQLSGYGTNTLTLLVPD